MSGPQPDRAHALTAWAAGTAGRVLASFGSALTDPRPLRAVDLAGSWADGAVDDDACRDAAFDAQLAARDAQEAGYRDLAVAIRAAATAAASVDDSRLALEASTLALQALSASSAACERTSVLEHERRRQWDDLPASMRPDVFGDEEPGEPSAPSCRLD